jgi:hypothetical protein
LPAAALKRSAPVTVRRRAAGLLERVTVAVLGVYLGGTGLSALRRGHWLYTDYLGLEVPAPLALLAASLLLALAARPWSKWR